ncbi:rCG60710, isoform CRA_a [Rattus norvegicus]|uniref:Protein ILRUN n=1 Tax=Rattus norvegicus TaxID=10116 RepID=A6JJN4_RAT|nr:rCG60710, isoform CRA_a [Rattus norvegicus]EDL96901.1 rCG60710, isoform CRA_a [Rattus norvegicus]
MQKFSCLGTTDKDVLISEFQRLLGFQLNPAGCAFFLDMTNWNLQAAIGAYYDFESPNVSVPSMSFVEDVTIGEGESIPPDTQFIKTWRIQNSGAEAWPPGVCLKYVGGDQFGHVNMVMVRSLEPQEIADVSVQMCSPSRAGMYQGQWRMCTATGLYYGGAPRALPLRPVLNGCQQEEKLTKTEGLTLGGEGKGFLWIAEHIAWTPGSDPHLPPNHGRRGRKRLVLSELSMRV